VIAHFFFCFVFFPQIFRVIFESDGTLVVRDPAPPGENHPHLSPAKTLEGCFSFMGPSRHESHHVHVFLRDIFSSVCEIGLTAQKQGAVIREEFLFSFFSSGLGIVQSSPCPPSQDKLTAFDAQYGNKLIARGI